MEYNSERQLCGFRLGDTTYAIPLANVQEVIASRSVTPMPRSPEYVEGLVDFKGKIVVSVNVGKLLGLGKTTSSNSMNIIVRSENGFCCLIVDEVLDVVDVSGRMINEAPGNIDEKIKFFIEGIYKMDKSLAIVLNLEKILNTNKLL